jgi:ADP-ribose pyrophosphatase YjhB (NUDIX family)
VARVLSVPLLWLSGRTNRKRLAGARVEVIGFLMVRTPEPAILLAKSVYDGYWMPPQEGVNFRESLLGALARGFAEECSLQLLDPAGKVRSDVTLRDISYLGTLRLPPERWGERSIAGNVGDSPLSHIRMTKKAYWGAFIIAHDREALECHPNMREITELCWMTFDQAAVAVRHNRPEKGALLLAGLRRAMQHVSGARVANEWLPPGEA